jgi:hypothetical protein
MTFLRALVTLFVFPALLSCGSSSWVDLDSIEELRTRFNADRGQARLVLLLSPT